MKTKLFLFVAVALLALSLAGCATPAVFAQTTPDKLSTRQLTATGNGKVYLVPDLAYIFIGVRAEADTVGDALSQNNQKSQAVAASLKELGVDLKDIQTSAFNVLPQQQFDPQGKPLQITYLVENTINVTVRDLNKLGQLLDVVARNGANNINGIQFDVKDKETATSQARKVAIEDARKQAQEMAAAAGVTLGDVQTLNVYASNGPVPMFEGKGGGQASVASSVPISSGQLVITMDASIVFEIK
jgi:uncharacterized protein YggE